MSYIKLSSTLWERHKNCDCYVNRDYQAKRSRSKFNQQLLAHGVNPNPPALICRQHGAWIKWLSPQEADDIELILASNHYV